MEDNNTNPTELYISEVCEIQLKKSAKWAKLIGVFSILFSFVFFILSIVMLSGSGGMLSKGLVGFHIILGVFLIYFGMLFVNFGKKTIKGIEFGIQDELESGIDHLRRYFKISAILQIAAILMNVFSVLVFIFKH